MYSTGYNGTTRTLEQLLVWSHWVNLDGEYQRRGLAILDASQVAGRPLGIGSIFRTYQGTLDLAMSRHYPVASGGCCRWLRQRYALRTGNAHAAFPGLSYHEGCTSKKKALAIDFTGDLTFLKENAAKYGLKEFSTVNREPWHGQPLELPNSRSKYVLATMDPLNSWTLPGLPAPAPTKIFAPTPTLEQETRLTQNKDQVRSLQHTCNFWGWRDVYNKTLLVDGDFGAKTDQAVRSMQRGLGQFVDGVYGSQSAKALQGFLDLMVRWEQ